MLRGSADMDFATNTTLYEAAWQSALDALQDHIENARHTPAWALSVVVMCVVVLVFLSSITLYVCTRALVARMRRMRNAQLANRALLQEGTMFSDPENVQRKSAQEDDL